VGKTTVAETVADRLEGELLRTDVVRRELFTHPAYTDEERRAVYRALFDRARPRLDRGENVVLDGTIAATSHRERAGELAAAAGVEHRLARVTCKERVVRERIEARIDDASDAGFGVYRTIRAAFEPIDAEHTSVDNSGDQCALRRQVAALFGGG
jgi:hypothetical protein